ncbi:MAG: Gfo/Idh/MocA family oxidoreductase [bacterium]|nr:Gfo/Idh/MocA family oxidoreductase [bacterium]MDZ4299519.1 Gfo/Idh/MocA family oxidoreductase [Candidatus Sungbacteria bacterium]
MILRFGLIGLGYFGKNYLRLLQQMEGVELVAVANHEPEAFVAHAALLPPAIKRYQDAAELIADPAIDAIVIATPASTHVALAQQALEAGKHALIEKPMVRSSVEAEELARAVKESGKILMVGHQYIYHDSIRHLKKELESGRLGRVAFVFAEHFYFGPVRNDIPLLWETATHELALLDYVFGSREITSVSGKKISVVGGGQDDFIHTAISFADEMVLNVSVSWFMPQKIRRMAFIGTKGIALFDDQLAKQKLKFIMQKYPATCEGDTASTWFGAAEEKIIIPDVAAHEPLRNEVEHFISCIRSGAEPLTGIAHGMRITHLLEEIDSRLG